jgi:aspartyl-tRNA(Asn)/glutamyl-tRNA(Gln) amidotransferase subunit B
MSDWESVIGLEIHAQLKTVSKIFSGASTVFGAAPNAQACAVDLGLPGVLPVLNQDVIRMAVMFGLAIEAEIPPRSIFARKNYFYPDLPKGYQISQFEHPVVAMGHVQINVPEDGDLRINITRAHLEEDAGKSVHDAYQGKTGIDLNRAGMPLIEIVSEPDMRSARQATAYMRKIHSIVRYLNICDGNMQEGSFRCDANVSMRKVGTQELGTRTETKNLNSFRYVERAINFEIERQIDLLESGQSIVQETRLYDPALNETRTMRSKEEANDYRYFPDPDLLPVDISQDYIEDIRAQLPELPDAKRQRFCETYGLSTDQASILSASRDMADFYEASVNQIPALAIPAANWIIGDLNAALNKADLDINSAPITAQQLSIILQRIEDNTLSGKTAKQVFEAVWAGEGEPDAVIESKGLRQLTDSSAIEALVNEAIQSNPEQVQQYRDGNQKVLGFFVGHIMKASQGKANPKQVNELLRKALGNS